MPFAAAVPSTTTASSRMRSPVRRYEYANTPLPASSNGRVRAHRSRTQASSSTSSAYAASASCVNDIADRDRAQRTVALASGRHAEGAARTPEPPPQRFRRATAPSAARLRTTTVSRRGGRATGRRRRASAGSRARPLRCATPARLHGPVAAVGELEVHAGARGAARARSADLLSEPDEDPFGSSDVAEPVRVFVLDHLADELCAVLAEPGECVVEVLHGEHDAQVAEGVHGRSPMIGDDGRREKSRELEPAVTVRRAHHGDLDALVSKPRDAPCPLPFDHHPRFELESQLGEERNSGIERFHHDAHVVHSLDRHRLPAFPPSWYFIP